MDIAPISALLNRRHKTAMCATLICVGLILLLGGAVRSAVGIALLGIAFSWVFGSDYRLVHWLFVILGLLLLAFVVADAFLWSTSKSRVVETQSSIVQNDRETIRLDTSIGAESPDKQQQRENQRNLEKDYDELSRDEQALRTLQTDGALRHVLRNDWGTVLGAVFLLSAGLGLLIGAKPKRKGQTDSV